MFVKRFVGVDDETCPRCKAKVMPYYRVTHAQKCGMRGRSANRPYVWHWTCPKCGGRNSKPIYDGQGVPEVQTVLVRIEDLKESL